MAYEQRSSSPSLLGEVAAAKRLTEGQSRDRPLHHDACGVAVPLPEQARGGMK